VFVLPLALSGCIVVAKGGSPPDPSSPAPTHVQTVTTSRAPAPVGPYSQARLAGNTLYLAGQIGLDPETGEMVAGGVEAETRQAMANLNAVLRSAGFTFEDVVSTQVFLADIGDYGAMNAVYAEHFEAAPPARAALQVAALPLGARVEILMTAVRRPR
jgi:2-iminobutanoate/2-iminopropanoate deaminase